MTGAKAWPSATARRPMPYSMNSLPSTSHTWQPCAAHEDRQRVGGILVVALGVGVGAAGNEAVQALGQRQRSVEARFFPFVGH